MYWNCCDLADFSREDLQRAYTRLSPSRKEHIDRLRQNQDKHRSLAAQLMVEDLLSRHYGITDALLHRRENGCPYLTGCDLFVSISHCDTMIACAVSESAVGIDIERIRPTKERLFQKVCVEAELHYVLPRELTDGVCTDTQVLRRFFEIWTAKEAYFKKCGTGITDLKSVNVLELSPKTHFINDFVLQIL